MVIEPLWTVWTRWLTSSDDATRLMPSSLICDFSRSSRLSLVPLFHFIELVTVTQYGDKGWNRTFKSQLISTPSLSTQPMKGCTTPSGSTPPTLYEQQCGFFYVPQESEQGKSSETGPMVFRPYPGRLECLTICRCHNKGSTFTSVILRPCQRVLVRPGFEPATSLSADRRLHSDH